MSEGDRADRTDSTGAGDRLGGVDAIRVLPDGVVRLSDPSVRATARDGPPAVAWPIAHRGRVTLLHAREKVGKSTLRAAVAAVTRGEPFLEQPTIGGRVLWVGDEAVAAVKGQLAESAADLDRVFCIRGLRPDTDDESSLPRLVARLRPVWVIIDPWQHYLKVYRVTGAAAPGAQGLLLGDIVDLAREYEAAVTVSHYNAKNRPDAYEVSTALGAVADRVVSLGRGESPTTRRLPPSGRWHLDPVAIRWTGGLGYSVVRDTEQTERSGKPHARPIDDHVLLHLRELGAEVRPSARELASKLRCRGRRYEELRSALGRLLAEGVVDCVQRPGARSGRNRGYALTERGRHRAETLRNPSDCGVSTNGEQAEACSEGATVSEVASPAVAGNGNAATRAREEHAQACSEGASVSEASPAVAGNGNTNTTLAREEQAEACSEGATVSEVASPAVAGNGNTNTTPAREKQAQACSEGATVSQVAPSAVAGNATPPAEVQEGQSGAGGAGHVGDEVAGDGSAEPASRRSSARQLEDRLLHLFRPHGESETRLMFRTVLTLFRHSGQSVEGVSPAFIRLVADGFLHKVPSQYYPEPCYALTERGRHRVASPAKGTNWWPASTNKE